MTAQDKRKLIRFICMQAISFLLWFVLMAVLVSLFSVCRNIVAMFRPFLRELAMINDFVVVIA